MDAAHALIRLVFVRIVHARAPSSCLLFPPRLAEGLSSAYTDLRDVVMLPDVGHFVPLEAAVETAMVGALDALFEKVVM